MESTGGRRGAAAKPRALRAYSGRPRPKGALEGAARAGRGDYESMRSAAAEARLSLPCAIERLSGGISHRTCNPCPIGMFARLDRILGDIRSGLVAPYRPRVEIASSERLLWRVSRCVTHVRTFPDRLALRVGSAERGTGSRGTGSPSNSDANCSHASAIRSNHDRAAWSTESFHISRQ
jgi:hypothetical protein